MSESTFRDKVVLITGGTGSFGQAFAKCLLEEDACKKVIIFSRDEWKQWQIQQGDPIFRHPKIRFFLGDVRDVNRLYRAFNEVDYVVHAAALKQVPAAEYNPSEFIKTNITGAMNVIDAALVCRVEKVIALSTDKAANPTNLYGATKLCSDKLFCSANAYTGSSGSPQFSAVRYGNVVGSRGSVISLWQKLKEEGKKEIPITDARMTRFWITLDHAVDFVKNCFTHMRGGELFVPKIPSMKIVDLAKAIAPEMEPVFIGIRPGEKLHELMISADDARHSLEFEDHYFIIPEYLNQHPESLQKFLANRNGKRPLENFAYTSDTNTQWLTVEDLRKIL